MSVLYPNEQRVKDARTAAGANVSGFRTAVPFDPSLFPKTSKPGRSECSIKGCRNIPWVAFIAVSEYANSTANCITHAPDSCFE